MVRVGATEPVAARVAAVALLVVLFVLHVWQCVAGADLPRPLAAAASGTMVTVDAQWSAVSGPAPVDRSVATVAVVPSPADPMSAVGDGPVAPVLGEVVRGACLVLLTVATVLSLGALRRWMLRAPVHRAPADRAPDRPWAGWDLSRLCVLRT
ncbi:hypothetical protein [Micromonospora radicis]|uniref:hypothetical protein n=1 Tax=Micromonospora radicis TaxID=1894971 RepID=UPI0011C480FC|nr:hypothetical protein [Micromonospora radicis]